MNTKKGFTLVEVLVAIGLFSILVGIAAGGFVRALQTQREVAGLIAAQSNASLAMEQMAREIRTGYLFCDVASSTLPTPSAPCAFPHCSINGNIWTCDILDFWNAQVAEVQYSCPQCATGGGPLMRSDNTEGGIAEPITGDNVVVKYLTFTLFGNTEDDHWPPRVTIAMGVSPSSTDPAIANDVLNLETSVSARGVDCSASGC